MFLYILVKFQGSNLTYGLRKTRQFLRKHITEFNFYQGCIRLAFKKIIIIIQRKSINPSVPVTMLFKFFPTAEIISLKVSKGTKHKASVFFMVFNLISAVFAASPFPSESQG